MMEQTHATCSNYNELPMTWKRDDVKFSVSFLFALLIIGHSIKGINAKRLMMAWGIINGWLMSMFIV